MTKQSFILRNVVAIAICLAGVFSVNNVLAQDYVGTYSGTLTFTLTEFPLDESLLNTTIENQILEVNLNHIFFPAIPILKEGEPSDIGFAPTEFAPNGDITAPPEQGNFNDIALTFTIVSGNVSNNMINLTFQILDDNTGGAIVDVTANYTGTKQTNSINDISAKSLLKVYPSPANTTLNVALEKSANNGIFMLFDMSGKMVLSQSVNGNSAQINISTLSVGNYILRLVENGAVSEGVQVIKN
jgi:hypothetical protein